MLQSLRSVPSAAGLLAGALIVSGCFAVTRDFPGLGDPPADLMATEGEARLSPVSIPPPARSPEELDAAAARALRDEAAVRLEAIAGAIATLTAEVETAMQAARESGAALDRRTAHFRFSRLSRLETEASALIRRLSALPDADRSDTALRRRAMALRQRLAQELETFRPGLAALGPAAG